MQWLADSDKDWTLEWLGLEEDGSVFGGFGPLGVDTLLLDLEHGFTISHEWVTDIHKPASGGPERRISRNDVPRLKFKGSALLIGDKPREVRAKMARYAATAQPFMLALPHEQLTFRADASGSVVFVHSGALALTDWAKRGQRVVVARKENNVWKFVNAIIQDKTSNSITVDASLGTLGKVGGVIMPVLPIYLEPQQNFPRYPLNVERWELEGRALLLDYVPTLASLALGPITASSALDNVVFTARVFGALGNTIEVNFQEDASYPAAGALIEADYEVEIHFKGGVTTLDQIATLLAGSSYIKMTGTWTGSATLASGTGDEFLNQFLSGAPAGGDTGTGASLTTYSGDGTSRPVWDRDIDNESTNTDSVHGMTKVSDHGGVPSALSTVDKPEWFRAVVLKGVQDVLDAERQWLRLFMSTIKGRQKAFWLPTWRHDLNFVSKAANTVTVRTDDGSDFVAWWPYQREHIQIVETNGTITRAKITAAVDNGNGTRTLTIGVTLATSSVRMISWLEKCRFEQDAYDIPFNVEGFTFSSVARVIA